MPARGGLPGPAAARRDLPRPSAGCSARDGPAPVGMGQINRVIQIMFGKISRPGPGAELGRTKKTASAPARIAASARGGHRSRREQFDWTGLIRQHKWTIRHGHHPSHRHPARYPRAFHQFGDDTAGHETRPVRCGGRTARYSSRSVWMQRAVLVIENHIGWRCVIMRIRHRQIIQGHPATHRCRPGSGLCPQSVPRLPLPSGPHLPERPVDHRP